MRYDNIDLYYYHKNNNECKFGTLTHICKYSADRKLRDDIWLMHLFNS